MLQMRRGTAGEYDSKLNLTKIQFKTNLELKENIRINKRNIELVHILKYFTGDQI